MQRRAAVVLFLLIFTTGAFAKEVFLPVSGTANNVFFSDARIFNPNDKEITVQAYYLPRGNNSNAGEQPISFTVPKRQMKISDDIVKNLLLRADVGGIRFVSPDDFVVTQRVYALSTVNCAGPLNPCTLGQFVQGLELSAAVKKGVILQLKAGEKFRTNVGALNPNAVPATVTWRLYDKDNKLVSTGAPIVMPPYATIGPSSITTTFFFNPGTADITDAWVSFDSDQPIFAYGSVVDNGSSDQTYIPASGDSGVTPPVEPPPPAVKVVDVRAVNWEFNLSGTAGLKAGDQVKFVIKADDGIHGFRLFSPSSDILIDLGQVDGVTTERTVTLPAAGSYQYICTRALCGAGHEDMNGAFTVGN